MVGPAAGNARFEGITTEVMALAALRWTDVVRTEHHGQVLSCVRGHLKDEDRETVLFPGEIPPDLPEPRGLEPAAASASGSSRRGGCAAGADRRSTSASTRRWSS